MKQVRPEPEYFRVGFYGKGFPSSVRVRPSTKKSFEEYRMSLYFCIGREGRSDVCPYCTRHWWYMTNALGILLMWCVWFNQSKSQHWRARGSHGKIRWREMSTPPSIVLIGQCKRTPSERLSKRYQRAKGALEMLTRVKLLSQHYL